MGILQQTALEDAVTPIGTPQPSLTPERLDERIEQTEAVETAIVSGYLSLPDDERDDAAPIFGRAYVEASALVKRESRDKSVYGQNDLYSPETYRQIYERSKSVCYVSSGADRLGTCFMIGTNLILTCDHVLKRSDSPDDYHDIGALRVRFGSGASPDTEEAYSVRSVVFRGTESYVDGVPTHALDFVLLELGRGLATQMLPSQQGIEPLPIDPNSKHPAKTAVYVIGYPGSRGNKTVADNSRIFLGFNNTKEEHIKYSLEAQNEATALLAQAEEKHRKSDEGTRLSAVQIARKEGDQLLKSVETSFRRGRSDPPRWYLLSELMDVPAQPAFALDSDTSHGNSGSPVFSRKSSEVTGVLSRGMPDDKMGLPVGYLQHEEAIPIHVILQNWKEKHPADLAKYGISY